METPNIIIYILKVMILKFIRHSTIQVQNHYKFASAAAAAIDYYSLLGVEKGATKDQISQAFSKLTRNINVEANSAIFSRLTEAFVILTDGKARDAYDSLMKVRKYSYINEPTPKAPSTQSYIAERKAERQAQFRKKHNIDKFGRYRGGIPNPINQNRGTAKGPIGQLFHPSDVVDEIQFPEYQAVDSARAESFKNFHQDERQYRTIKRPWYTMQVDYEFFSFKRFLDRLGYIKHFLFIMIMFPLLYTRYINLKKKAVVFIEEQKKKRKRLQAERQQKLRLAEEQKAAEQKAAAQLKAAEQVKAAELKAAQQRATAEESK